MYNEAGRTRGRMVNRLLFTGLVATVLAILPGGLVLALDNASHDVTVEVSAINEIAVTGTVSLAISTATAGQELAPVTDAIVDALKWTCNAATKKITVETTAAPPCTLKVVGENASAGTPAAEVTLSMTPADFVTAIGKTFGDCDLKYTLSATASEGTITSQAVTVKYTIAAG